MQTKAKAEIDVFSWQESKAGDFVKRYLREVYCENFAAHFIVGSGRRTTATIRMPKDEEDVLKCKLI